MRSITKTRKCQFFYEGFYFESPQAYAAWVKEQTDAFSEAIIGFLKSRQLSIAA